MSMLFQGRCCRPGPEERREDTERSWTLTRLAIRGRRNTPRRRGRAGNLGLVRDCFRSCVILLSFVMRVKLSVNVKCTYSYSTWDGPYPHSMHQWDVIISDSRWPPQLHSASTPATRTPPSGCGRAAGPRWRPTTSCCLSSSRTSRPMPSNAL